jgi:hypothetical protein
MSLRILTVALLLITAAAYADPPTQPWLWSDADRISARFDKDAVRARVADARTTVRVVPADRIPVDGRKNPELFFPWELLDHFLRVLQTDAVQAQSAREAYRAHIENAGWTYDDFWRFMDESSLTYSAALLKSLDELEQNAGKLRPDVRAHLQHELCESRAALLEASRERFGRTEFDKFLYTAVAPHLRIWSSPERDGGVLLRVQRGCK